ncbi:DUF4917 family protein [bacterium AH-315-L15]|nr:DUF4917 family protein [bacterium AH-315-L15]
MELKTYNQVIKYLDKKNRPHHLLLGNGFSMAYDSSIFSYNALNRFIDEIDNDLLSKLFEIVNTKNFELVMQQLDNFYELVEVFGTDKSLKRKVKNASKKLKKSLIDAIRSLHPEHVFVIPEEKSQVCASFLVRYLSGGKKVFTTNYDVLLYWVLMRNHHKLPDHVDGFGRDLENDDEYVPEDEREYSELRWGRNREGQNIFYVHGTLPIFDTGIEIVKEEYDTSNYLMENIESRLDKQEYPIFVTAGNGQEKLTHIMHNRYLTDCYENLCNIDGSLVTFGFNFGENDGHIIDAINIAAKQGKKTNPRLWSIYVGVYSEEDKRHIVQIERKFKCKVQIYDSNTAPIWKI